ncbi:phosphoenolpyruvate--protein phosphotransferase [Desulfogranum japonicum]|uniref:phosphoenolpyruvate--protein phosphotransferase n=1 Tax=Desulfogranum japonicum TaxID=231447 RepID=UPI0004239985|nr:phosphoenolpyruvate--protein phosphotransferase [Desulfogranum japonicum]
MVGIVVVSHSRTLVAGLKELVAQMVPQMEQIAFVGGIDDPENPIGTDPMQVMDAINRVAGRDGVLVLMDLGSALLSAETALDFLDTEVKELVRLSPAPVIEGTLVAAIQASLGANLEVVAREAENALRAKNSQLGYEAVSTLPEENITPRGLELRLVIHNPNGLHARPASRLVGCAGSFQADISVEKDGKLVNAKSINQVTTLGIRQGETVIFRFQGEDAEAAREAVRKLHGESFGESSAVFVAEPLAMPNTLSVEMEDGLCGIPVSEGIVIGVAALPDIRVPDVELVLCDDVDAEVARLEKAQLLAIEECEQLEQKAEQDFGSEEADIFTFHKLLLQDAETRQAAKKLITEEKYSAEYAWKTVTDGVAEEYRNIDDDYLRLRAADVVDIQRAVLVQLSDIFTPSFDFEEPVILIVHDLSPSEVAGLPKDKILGLCLAAGGPTSHAAIIAGSRGIPTITGIMEALSLVKDGQTVILDGGSGCLYPHPDKRTLAEYYFRQREQEHKRQILREQSHGPAITRDGVEIQIAANIAGTPDLALALEYDARGIGLFRTEFLFLDRDASPDEEEQYHIYRTVGQEMQNRPVIIRTLDIGGDKPVTYLHSEKERNPFLGLRGIRFTLANQELFLCQLRAILRASHGNGIHIMFPMVGTVQELKDAIALLEIAKRQVRGNQQSYNNDIPVGIMIEVPSAVAVADQLAPLVNFFSIGTNDLSQYVMAAERGNPRVALLPDPLHPAVLRMMKMAIDAAHRCNIHVGMCGALAGMPKAAGLLIGLGVDELSMNAPMIPGQKGAVRDIHTIEAQKIAEQALAMTSPEEVRTLLQMDEG